MKAGVITFPGSNCDDDAVYTLEKSGFEVTRVWHKDPTSFSGYDLVVLPGGFSYGDYLRTGAMAAVSPIIQSVRDFADGGGLVLGICNGFQILCEMGLVPGALARNSNLSFVCKDVTLEVVDTKSPWTCGMSAGESVIYPIAHGEGRYIVSAEEQSRMEANGQVLLRYRDNPNGSQGDIAGVCNEKKNVFGLMPHPERATDLRSKDGVKLWKSIQTFLGNKV